MHVVQSINKRHLGNNENGSVLVIALVMLVLLTILGIMATSTSNIELQIAGNERNYKRTFFVANSGIEHLKEDLNDELVDANESLIAAGEEPTWTFALESATGTSYEDGYTRIDTTSFVPDGNYTYSVRLWDDDDGDSDPTTDTNHIIYAQANATGPNNAAVKIRVQLYATVDGEAITSYTAQQGGESGKGYGSQDLNPVDTFTEQL